MKRNNPVKAYKNIDFLNSPQARTVRISFEFLEPLSRFRREGIHDTFVIFGSARILPRKLVKKQLDDIQKVHIELRLNSKKHKQNLEEAKIDFVMSRYYDDALKLSSILILQNGLSH